MKHIFLKYICLLLVMVVSMVAVAAPSRVKIQGKVTDEQDQPIEFATVRIGGTAIGTSTGLDGTYQLSTAYSDTIKVHVACIGFKEVTRTLIEPQGDVTLNVRLMDNSNVLGELEVTEYRKETSTMGKISIDELKRQPDVSGNGVESLITTMAGVNSSNEMSSQYSVRGGTFDENSVYLNGVEVYRPQLISSGQQEGLSIINPDMVGAIGFSTGGFSAEYSDKMSSVLDITYRQPEAFEGSVSASLMGGSIALGQSSKKFSQLHGVRYKSNSSLLSSMETRGEYDPNFFDYQTNLIFSPSSRFKVSFLGNIAINNYKFTPQDRTTNFGTSTDAKQFKVYFDGHEKDKFETYFGALSLQYFPSKSTVFTLLGSGYLTNELVSYDISGEYWLDQAGTGEVGGELGVGRYMEHARNRLKASVMQLALRGTTGVNGHSIAYGLSIAGEKIMDRTSEWEKRDSAGYSLPHDPNLVKVIYSLSSHHDVSSTRLSMFAMDTYKLQTGLGYLSINGGLRLSYWSFNKEWLLSPRISLGLVPDQNPRWTFRFATGLYYQSPFYKEYRMPVVDVDGNTNIVLNTNIKSQRSLQFIAGSDYTFRALNRPFKLTAEAYYKALSNIIPYEIDNLKLVYSGLNETNGFAAGLDFKLYGQFVPGSDSWISFSLMKTQETLNGVKVPRPSDQRYSFALYFTDYFPKWPKLKFSLRGIFSDGLPVTAPRSSRDKGYFRTPAYKRVDIGLSYALLSPLEQGATRRGFLRHIKSAWIGLDCFNLLDISNVSSYYWVTDVNEIQYAVPNYLTRRQLNVRLSVEF